VHAAVTHGTGSSGTQFTFLQGEGIVPHGTSPQRPAGWACWADATVCVEASADGASGFELQAETITDTPRTITNITDFMAD